MSTKWKMAVVGIGVALLFVVMLLVVLHLALGKLVESMF